MTGEIPKLLPHAERPQGSALLQTSIHEVGEKFNKLQARGVGLGSQPGLQIIGALNNKCCNKGQF